MKRYAMNLLLALDQLGNALAGGRLETISSRLGKWKLHRLQHRSWPPSPWHPAYWLERSLDWIDPNHVLDAIESDECEASVLWNVNVPRR